MNGPPTLKLQPPHGEFPTTFWEAHHWQVIGGIAAFVIFAALVAIWFWLPGLVAVEPPIETARRELEALRGQVANDKLVADVSRILRRYLWAAFRFPPGELTTTEIHGFLRTHPRINPNVAATIGNFLRRCDELKFAPAPPSPQPAIVQEAKDLAEHIHLLLQPGLASQMKPASTAA